MITIRKLKTLKPGTLRRKTAVLLRAFEEDLMQGKTVDEVYLLQLTEVTADAFSESAGIVSGAAALQRASGPDDRLRRINSLRHQILKQLGTEPADWDLSVSHSPVAAGSAGPGPGIENSGAAVYLDDIRSPFNLGSIFRTAEAFGAGRIFLSPDCPSPGHPRARRTSMGCTDVLEWERAERDVLLGELPVFALELGGTPLSEFTFPSRGIAVIGSEELGISPEAREAAVKSHGLVSIPVFGRKGSINVSVAFGIMMQRWSEFLYLQ